jgi:arsenite-transporting ATPase
MICHSAPEYFKNKELQLIIFGGKGGVGKTTMAATAALQLSRSYHKDKKVLVVSTDPAHSLSDSFDTSVGDKITPIEYRSKSEVQVTESDVRSPMSNVQSPGAVVSDQWSAFGREGPTPRGVVTADEKNSTFDTNLFALELDASRLLEQFKQENGPVIKELADRGTYFDKEDISEFFNLSLPGMDEVMAIIEMANLLRSGEYQVIVLDTAPTGHTLRMLALPEQMQRWVEVMDLMQHKYRYMATHFAGRKYKKDQCDLFLGRLSSDIDRVRKLLTRQKSTRFIAVTIPEPMSLYETKRLVKSLEGMDIPVKEMIVNRVEDEDGCDFCCSRKEAQRQTLAEIEESFSGYGLTKVPIFPTEIRGVKGLIRLADFLMGSPRSVEVAKASEGYEMPSTRLALQPDLELIIFGGKGGVGKTTIASAAALHLAKERPQNKVLLFSTDPAHSLSDAFDQSIGDKITPIEYSAKSEVRSPKSEGQRGTSNVQSQEKDSTLELGPWTSDNTNLFALEIDPVRLFDDFRREFRDSIEEMFDRFLSNKIDIKFDREVMAELLTLAPPGLDEIMGLDRIMELREQEEFDIFVLDTSPTGHLLRFLDLPDMVREWLKAFFRLLLKYRGVVRLTGAAEKALAISKNVRRIQETLVDPQRTAFVAVTIPEAMAVVELERLAGALENVQIPCEHIVVNMVISKTYCPFCSSKRGEQQGYMNKIRSEFPNRIIAEAPLFSKEVRGISDLNKIGEVIFGGANFID